MHKVYSFIFYLLLILIFAFVGRFIGWHLGDVVVFLMDKGIPLRSMGLYLAIISAFILTLIKPVFKGK